MKIEMKKNFEKINSGHNFFDLERKNFNQRSRIFSPCTDEQFK